MRCASAVAVHFLQVHGGSFLSILPLASRIVVADLVLLALIASRRHPIRASAGFVRCLLPLSCLRRHSRFLVLLQPTTLRVPRVPSDRFSDSRRSAVRLDARCARTCSPYASARCRASSCFCVAMSSRCSSKNVACAGSPCCNTLSNGCRISRSSALLNLDIATYSVVESVFLPTFRSTTPVPIVRP